MLAEFSTCVKCGYESSESATFCVQCRGRMLTSNRVRKLGWVAAITGVFLVALTTFVIVWEVRAMLPGAQTKLGGGTRFIVQMFLLEGDLFSLGLISLLAGICQIKHGKRNRALNYAVIALALAAVGMSLVLTNSGKS